MTYEGMSISDGQQAGLAWEKMVRGNNSRKEKKELQDALKAYCKQDTLAMVKVLKLIRKEGLL
jgi:hypothetical protein